MNSLNRVSFILMLSSRKVSMRGNGLLDKNTPPFMRYSLYLCPYDNVVFLPAGAVLDQQVAPRSPLSTHAYYDFSPPCLEANPRLLPVPRTPEKHFTLPNHSKLNRV
jgi:hypothetical protein